ncbi:MAG: 3'(2'),5'-bisphosphate nucleotidase CysQ [Pseudomonadota bacterium]
MSVELVHQMLEPCRSAALEAGDAIMQVRAEADKKVQQKADFSPVTAADLAADQIISQRLRADFPDIVLTTEEQAATHVGQPPEAFFIVDPLDGTKDFIRGDKDFTVNIAYVEQGCPVFGIVYAPAHDRLFYTSDDGSAVEEIGPFDKKTIGQTVKLNVSDDCSGALTIVASKSHRDEATEDYISKYDVSGFRSAGSSLKFCLVASGEADLYPRLGRTMEWDTAAGDAILRAAGGKVLCFDAHTPLEYGKPGYANGHFIAASSAVGIKR